MQPNSLLDYLAEELNEEPKETHQKIILDLGRMCEYKMQYYVSEC
jgi:hypothetical protein